MFRGRRLSLDGAGGGAGEGEPQPDGVVEDRVTAAEARASEAVAHYRELVASGPDLIAEMVRGDTIEEVEASAEAARRAYSDIRRRVAEQHEREIPAGNPARSATPAGAEYLSPEAKIAFGLSRAER